MLAVETMEPLVRLSKDLKKAAVQLSDREARYLVDLYYQVQDYRKSSNNQIMSMSEDGEPVGLFGWVSGNLEMLEGDIRRALASYADGQKPGVWAQTVCGIGPVIAAGLLAHIDITQAPTVGHIWRFAGLDPTVKWETKTKRPWNAALKVLCWKIGESFVKVSNNAKDVYGHVYAERKAQEAERNEAGQFAEQAAAALSGKRYGADTVARKWYEQGKLPPAHIHARAKRYTVKLFLASYHEVVYYCEYGTMPPKPYILTQPGHVHWRMAPNAELVPGLSEAQEAARQGFMRGLLSEGGEGE